MYPRNKVRFKYLTVNTLNKSDNKYKDNNNNNINNNSKST